MSEEILFTQPVTVTAAFATSPASNGIIAQTSIAHACQRAACNWQKNHVRPQWKCTKGGVQTRVQHIPLDAEHEWPCWLQVVQARDVATNCLIALLIGHMRCAVRVLTEAFGSASSDRLRNVSRPMQAGMHFGIHAEQMHVSSYFSNRTGTSVLLLLLGSLAEL